MFEKAVHMNYLSQPLALLISNCESQWCSTKKMPTNSQVNNGSMTVLKICGSLKCLNYLGHTWKVSVAPVDTDFWRG